MLRPLLCLLAICPAPLLAQSFGGLPQHEPLNPASSSRSPLLLIPFQDAAARGWRTSVQVEYGNAIEYEVPTATTQYLLDAELMRAQFQLRRDLSRTSFIAVQTGVQGAYDGVADGFFSWYHNLIGYHQPERLARPKNTFGYYVELPDRTIERERMGFALTDTRITFGHRVRPWLQLAATGTLPTSTGPAGYGRGVPAIGAVASARGRPFERLVVEAEAGVGYAPTHGDLSPYQRTTFANAATGFTFRLFAGNAVYGYLYYHSPYYQNTTIRSLDRRELTGDFGWIIRYKSGREWRFGLSEDLAPGDAGIDLVLKVGTTW